MVTSLVLSKKIFFDNEDLITEQGKIKLKQLSEKYKCIILSNNSAKLKKEVLDFINDNIFFLTRNEFRSIYKANVSKLEKISIYVIGCVDKDADIGFNFKRMIFHPTWIEDCSEKITKYGHPVSNIDNLIRAIEIMAIHKNNYYTMNSSDQFVVTSIFNANTLGNYVSNDEKEIRDIFNKVLKKNNKRGFTELYYHIISEILKNPVYKSVDLWGVFPSSKEGNENEFMEYIKDRIRLINGKRITNNVFVRYSDMPAKKDSQSNRLIFKSSKDFETLEINPNLTKNPKNNIKGKTICIVDDYITNGYSAEAAKHILLNAGAKKVIFLSIGKYGSRYFNTNYQLISDKKSIYTRDYKFRFFNEKEHKTGYSQNSSELLTIYKMIE